MLTKKEVLKKIVNLLGTGTYLVLVEKANSIRTVMGGRMMDTENTPIPESASRVWLHGLLLTCFSNTVVKTNQANSGGQQAETFERYFSLLDLHFFFYSSRFMVHMLGFCSLRVAGNWCVLPAEGISLLFLQMFPSACTAGCIQAGAELQPVL